METSSRNKLLIALSYYVSEGYEFSTLKKLLINFAYSLRVGFKNTSKHLIICTNGATNYIL
jgi:hypothetical protein